MPSIAIRRSAMYDAYASAHGRQAADDYYDKLEMDYQLALARGQRDEELMARQAEKNPLRYAEDGSRLEWEMSTAGFVHFFRSSLKKPGAVGGEYLDDADRIRFEMKHRPEIARKAVTGNITEGWTQRLEAAACAGREERVRTQARVSTLLQSAAAQAPALVT